MTLLKIAVKLASCLGVLAASSLPAVRLAAADDCSIRLTDRTEASGITFQHTDGSTGRRYIVETVTAGMATFDYDGDGLIDIYFVNGAATPEARFDKPPRNALYRNQGNWRFVDVTDEAGVGDTGYGLGVAVADYDNDGDLDLYVSNFGPNVLYRNNGNGTFTDVTRQAGVGGGNKVGAGVCFLDADADGFVDLYSANYVRFNYKTHVETVVDGYPQYTGPKDYEPEIHDFYMNNGDGTFRDAGKESGVAAHAGTGMGVVCLDFDNDADTDIAVLNDVRGNFLFENDGSGHFEEIGLAAGIAYSADGMELGSMGIDCGDYNNDGWLDLYQTSYASELPALYENTGAGFFEDVTRASGAGEGCFSYVNWGTGFVDFDNDGDRDLLVANGHLQDNVHLYDTATSYEARNVVLMNTGKGHFVDVSDQCGDGLLPKLSSRGTALDDLDNDGDVDAVVLNSRKPPTLLRNDSANGNHWIEIRLRGVKSNRDGVGAQVRVRTGDLEQTDEVHSGRGYQSHHGMRLHYGLGKHDRIDRIQVRWVGGRIDTIENVAADQLITIEEGGQK